MGSDITCETNTAKRLVKDDRTQAKIEKYFVYVLSALIIVSTVYLYLWKYYSVKKPVFVTVIFVLLNLWWPFLVATEIISDHEDQWESNFIIKFTSLLDQWEEFDIVSVHWVFAITYFEAALKTPIFIASAQTGFVQCSVVAGLHGNGGVSRCRQKAFNTVRLSVTSRVTAFMLGFWL